MLHYSILYYIILYYIILYYIGCSEADVRDGDGDGDGEPGAERRPAGLASRRLQS